MSVVIFSDDLRQFAYCKRKVFLRRVIRAKFVPTYKMSLGRKIEKELNFPIGDGERLYRNYKIFDDVNNLGATVDILVVGSDYCKVIEVKIARASKRGIDEEHKIQLAFQVMLVKKVLGLDNVSSFVYYVDEDVLEEIRLDSRHFEKVQEYITEIREVIENEEIPEPTPIRSKCFECEYETYCKDHIL